jgi:hypothetical protein
MRSLASFFKLFALASLLAFLTCNALAQSAQPTSGVLTRVFMAQSPHFSGTIFSIDVDGREYWITAKHILTGASQPPWGSITDKSASLDILKPSAEGEQWLTVKFSVIDPGKDVDIVVLVAPTILQQDPLPSVATTSATVQLGSDCEFLGFPLGHKWRAKFGSGNPMWMPFVKHCTVSTLIDFATDKKIWFLDGINNHGFSGGPVVFKSGLDQQIMAVVSGFWTEEPDPKVLNSDALNPGPDRTNRDALKGSVYENPGFIVAYDISYAIDAIKNNPIGPSRGAK